MASEPIAGRFRRQHPLSWVFPTLTALRQTVVPAILFLVFWQGCAFGWLAVLFVVPALAIGVVKYLTTSYALTASELVVRDGVLNRNERRVRYSRIQNVDEIQGLVHRALGVVAIRVETASGGEAEAVLTLAPAAADELRSSVFATRGGEAEDDAAAPLVVVSNADLARLGLIRNRGLVVVAAVLGFAYQSGSDFVPMPWEWFGRWVRDVGTDLAAGERLPVGLGVFSWIAGVVFLVVGAYLLLSALSILLTVVRLGGFTLRRQGDDLTASFGLLARQRVTVPRRRIQRLQVEQSLLHRIWRRISMRLDTAGGREEAEDSPFKGADRMRGSQWLVPVTTRDRLDGLLGEALPGASRRPLTVDPETAGDDPATAWRPIDPRAVQRLFNRTSLLVLAVSFGLAWVTRWSLLLPVIALPLVWWVGHRSVRARRYWPTADALWWRRGWPGRRLVVVPYDKIQSVEVGESPFDRRYGMAAVIIDTAGSGMFPAAQISYLERREAHELARLLAREAGRSEFVWG